MTAVINKIVKKSKLLIANACSGRDGVEAIMPRWDLQASCIDFHNGHKLQFVESMKTRTQCLLQQPVKL